MGELVKYIILIIVGIALLIGLIIFIVGSLGYALKKLPSLICKVITILNGVAIIILLPVLAGTELDFFKPWWKAVILGIILAIIFAVVLETWSWVSNILQILFSIGGAFVFTSFFLMGLYYKFWARFGVSNPSDLQSIIFCIPLGLLFAIATLLQKKKQLGIYSNFLRRKRKNEVNSDEPIIEKIDNPFE